MINEQHYAAALELLAKEPRATILAAAKRNHNTAQQLRDTLLSITEDKELHEEIRARVAHVLDDVYEAENEARAQLEVIRGLFLDIPK